MAKNMQNENYKKKNTKRSKSNVHFNEYKPNNEKCLNRTSDQNNLKEESSSKTVTSSSSSSGGSNNYNNEKLNGSIKKIDENYASKINNCIENKVKNNFTIRGYRKRQDNRRKQDTVGNTNEIPAPFTSNRNKNKCDMKNEKQNTNSSCTSSSNCEQYLEAGTYEGNSTLIKNPDSGELSDDSDAHSIMSDYSDFCQREQYNVECYNYYLNFGDPYVMNNGEISVPVSDNSWYFERQPNFGRVFYYGNHTNDTCYEGAIRYNYPNNQEFKNRNIEPYTFCAPRDVYMNNYVVNGYNSYVNGYVEPMIMLSEYYPYQLIQPQDFLQERYYKPVMYEEVDDLYNPSNHYVQQENDTLNVINLNSSLFVYNSNVHINTVHNEIYGSSTITNNDIAELTENSNNSSNDTLNLPNSNFDDDTITSKENEMN